MSGRLVVGTRGSALALWQAHAVEQALSRVLPGVRVEIEVISTKGDRILDAPLEKIGDKGLFTKDLEEALLVGSVDMCVHSMKDVPGELPAGCVIGAMLPRADARDVLVCGTRVAGCRNLDDLPAGARLGTGSLRRTAQLRARHKQVIPKPIRGNVDTRLKKAQGVDYEGAILAAAGVLRMGAQEAVAAYLPIDDMLPAVGQGAIGVEVREGDSRTARACALVNDAATFACVSAERRVLGAFEGGCQVPLGAYARIEGGELLIDAAVFALDGSREVRVSRSWPADADAVVAADEVVAELLRLGAADLVAEALGEGGLL